MLFRRYTKKIMPVSLTLTGLCFLVFSTSVKAAPNAAAQLMQKLDQIQREIQTLRDEVEKQKFTLDSALKNQKDRYLDIDQRLESQDAQIKKIENLFLAIGADASALSNLTGNSSNSANPSASANQVSKPVQQTQQTKQTDVEAYEEATKLRSARKFDQAVVKFEQFIKNYPNSKYASNAYYWLGEIYMLENKTQEAEKMFSIVANKYSTSNKALDAWYKLGLVQARYGNMTKATNAMKALSTKFPNTSAGELAAAWLKRNK